MSFFFFFFYKIREQEGAPCLARVRLVPVGRESWWGKGVWGWIWYTHAHMYVNAKMIPAETIPRKRGGGNKRKWWRGWIEIWYIWNIVKSFVNATMNAVSAHHNNKKELSKWSKGNPSSRNIQQTTLSYKPL
jgi:hypothetical protein